MTDKGLHAKQRIKRQILRKRGLQRAGYGHVEPVAIDMPADPRKTLAMRLIEAQLGLPLEVLLTADGQAQDIARRLGIDPSTVSIWKLRLGLRGQPLVKGGA